MEDVEFKPTKNSRRFFFFMEVSHWAMTFCFNILSLSHLCWSNFILIYMVHYKNPYHPSVSLSSWWPKKVSLGPFFAQMLHNTVWLKCASQSPPTYHPFRSPRNVGWFPLQKLMILNNKLGDRQKGPGKILWVSKRSNLGDSNKKPWTGHCWYWYYWSEHSNLAGGRFSLLIFFLPLPAFSFPIQKSGSIPLSNTQDRWYEWYALMFVLYILIRWPY